LSNAMSSILYDLLLYFVSTTLPVKKISNLIISSFEGLLLIKTYR
jgi:hypothetical protein